MRKASSKRTVREIKGEAIVDSAGTLVAKTIQRLTVHVTESLLVQGDEVVSNAGWAVTQLGCKMLIRRAGD